LCLPVPSAFTTQIDGLNPPVTFTLARYDTYSWRTGAGVGAGVWVVGAGVAVGAADGAADGELDGKAVAELLGEAAAPLGAPDGDGLADDEQAAAATRMAIDSAAMRLVWRMIGSPKSTSWDQRQVRLHPAHGQHGSMHDLRQQVACPLLRLARLPHLLCRLGYSCGRSASSQIWATRS
jgi:hypothetical protein